MTNQIKELEARAFFEKDYDEEEVEDLIDVYKEVVKHIGFKDNRRDNRFVVKFHDIFYHTPQLNNEEQEIFDVLFEDFCNWQYESIMDDCKYNRIDIKSMLSNRMCGHYSTFLVEIPEITEENAAEVTEKLYDEGVSYDYVNDYVYVVESLEKMEKYYMEDWLNFIEDSDLPRNIIAETRENYEAYKEKHAIK